MPISVEWDSVVTTLLYVNIVLPWNWDDYHKGIETALLLISQKEIDGFIVNVCEAGDFPPTGFLNQTRRGLQRLPLVPIAFIANTPILKVVLAPIIRLVPNQRSFYFCDNLEDARKKLKTKQNSAFPS